MKNLSLVLNGILFAGLVVLYVLFFNQKNQVSSAQEIVDSLSTEIPQLEGGFAFVKMDSVFIKYEMAIDLSAELENDINTSEARLASKGRQLQKDAADLQNRAQRQLITRADAEMEQQSLMMREQELYQEQQQLQVSLAEKNQVMQNQVYNAIMEYIASIEEENNLRCVLGTAFGGNVLYNDPELDITPQVINGLNAEYRASKAE